MSDALSQKKPPAQDSLLEFPCEFPLKVMGISDSALAQTVFEIILRHAPDFDGKSIQMKPSRTGKYISLTCTIIATSKPQLDALYQELSAHPLVKVVL